jgi:hypothetical protein
MKYWLYLVAKLLIVVGATFGLQAALGHFYPLPAPPHGQLEKVPALFTDNGPFTFFATLGVWVIGVGLFFLAIWDQKRRCRTCLRRLIMPMAKGSWANMVIFGRPKTEWICPFGHGTLSIEELQITGRHAPDWHPHDDNIWKELESYQARK